MRYLGSEYSITPTFLQMNNGALDPSCKGDPIYSKLNPREISSFLVTPPIDRIVAIYAIQKSVESYGYEVCSPDVVPFYCKGDSATRLFLRTNAALSDGRRHFIDADHLLRVGRLDKFTASVIKSLDHGELEQFGYGKLNNLVTDAD